MSIKLSYRWHLPWQDISEISLKNTAHRRGSFSFVKLTDTNKPWMQIMFYFLKNQNISDLINRHLYSKYRFMSLYREKISFMSAACLRENWVYLCTGKDLQGGVKNRRNQSYSFYVCRGERKEKAFLLSNLFRSSPPFYQK